MVGICGADQGKIRLVRNGKDDAPVFALEEVAFVVIIQLGRHDVAAPHQPHPFRGIDAHGVADHVFHPRATGVDQHLGLYHALGAAVFRFQRDLPHAVHLLGRDDLGAGVDPCTTGLGVAGVQHHQTAVFDPAVGILIGLFELVLQRCPLGGLRQIDRGRPLEDLPPAQIVIHEQTQADQPRGATPLHPRHEHVQQL